MFESVDFVHITVIADSLSKDGTNILIGTWQISEHREDLCFKFVMPF